jgi:predicted small lipoprotein YifL
MSRPKYWIPAFAGMTELRMRALVLLCLTLLVACGQSGDLYLPPERPAPAATPADAPPPAEAPAEKEKDRK